MKTGCNSAPLNWRCLVAASLLAGTLSSMAQPTLGVVLTNRQILLYWPSNYTGYVLQGATNLAGTNWAAAGDALPVLYKSQTAFTVSNTVQMRFFRLSSTNASPAGMALVPAGWFTMGDTLDGESDAIPTNVFVSAFYMDTNFVSYSLWQSVYTYATNHSYSFVHAGAGKAANHPVQMVDWYDCVKWSNARSQQAGLTPAYYTDFGFTRLYTNGDYPTTVHLNSAANGFRLPTEAEWEKAARGGVSGQRFPWGNTISEAQANYYAQPATYSYDLGPYSGFNTNFNTGGGTAPYTSPGGYFAPNLYGLNDMAGNVFAWCWDWYGTPYLGTNDPTGPNSGSFRVLRGGAWTDNAQQARCANRQSDYPTDATLDYLGVRCVRGQ